MTDKPQITTIEEMRTALDEEIARAQDMVDLFQRAVDREKAKLEKYEDSLWRFKEVRSRLDPPAKLTLVGEGVA